MRRLTPLSMIFVGLLLLPALAMGHPPAVDTHAGCLQPFNRPAPAVPTVVVQQTLSYLDFLGTSLACPAAATAEWGSHSPPCPAPPFVGPIPGAFCGPLVPAGGFATCTWWPGLNTVPTELVIGFDPKPFGGVVVPPGPVFGSYPPGSWAAPNPYPTTARVIAFPTNIQVGTGVLAPGDWNNVGC